LGSTTSPGGLLALSSNSGSHNSADAIVIPESELRLKYCVLDHLNLTIGYSRIYWSLVARAGDQIDLAMNPDLAAPPAVPPWAQSGPNSHSTRSSKG